jgi:hypothetical protein
MGEGSPQSRPQAGDRRASERLDSWKEIAAYLKREIRTVQRWEKSLSLPIRRLADQQGVFAYKSGLPPPTSPIPSLASGSLNPSSAVAG